VTSGSPSIDDTRAILAAALPVFQAGEPWSFLIDKSTTRVSPLSAARIASAPTRHSYPGDLPIRIDDASQFFLVPADSIANIKPLTDFQNAAPACPSSALMAWNKFDTPAVSLFDSEDKPKERLR
jgi:hypothetical protein